MEAIQNEYNKIFEKITAKKMPEMPFEEMEKQRCFEEGQPMTLPVNEIYTGIKFFGQKIFLESSGEKETDTALKSVFWDSYHRTVPLETSREDCQLLLKWSRNEI